MSYHLDVGIQLRNKLLDGLDLGVTNSVFGMEQLPVEICDFDAIVVYYADCALKIVTTCMMMSRRAN